MRGSVPNYFSNSLQLVKRFAKPIVDAYEKSNINENLVNAAKRTVKNAVDFGDDVGQILGKNLGVSRYGNTTYGSYARPGEGFGIPRPDRTVRSAVQDPARFVADFLGSNVFSEKNRQKAWLYSNPFRLVSKAGVAASKFTGLEDPVAAGAVAAGVPILFHTLTETSGPLHQGLRPRGYKAVAPVSKEEDPTGAKPRNIAEEATLRFFGGQKSQPLAYKDFIKERPDVMPSTISDYRRYMNRKPEAGKRIDIDPEKQTFTAYGGLIKGTARGLNDPEIRIKGAPISASSVLGTAAAIGTITAGKRFLDPRGLGVTSDSTREAVERGFQPGKPVRASSIDRKVNKETGEVLGSTEYVVGTIPKVGLRTGRFYQSEPSYKGEGYAIPTQKLQDRLREQRDYRSRADAGVARAQREFDLSRTHPDAAARRKAKVDLDEAKEIRATAQQDIEETVRATKDFAKKNLNLAGQKFQEVFARNPGLKEPALVAGGVLAAVGTAAVAKKLFQKAEQERIKKEDPLQYKKYKRGDYTE